MNMKSFTNSQLRVMASRGGKCGRQASIELMTRQVVEKFSKDVEKTVDEIVDNDVESVPEVQEKPKRRGRRKKTEEIENE
jgi:hypothetical protein